MSIHADMRQCDRCGRLGTELTVYMCGEILKRGFDPNGLKTPYEHLCRDKDRCVSRAFKPPAKARPVTVLSSALLNRSVRL
jgi:hypothetical protein